VDGLTVGMILTSVTLYSDNRTSVAVSCNPLMH
jgi:hypothetical protein